MGPFFAGRTAGPVIHTSNAQHRNVSLLGGPRDGPRNRGAIFTGASKPRDKQTSSRSGCQARSTCGCPSPSGFSGNTGKGSPSQVEPGSPERTSVSQNPQVREVVVKTLGWDYEHDDAKSTNGCCRPKFRCAHLYRTRRRPNHASIRCFKRSLWLRRPTAMSASRDSLRQINRQIPRG